MNLNKFVVEEIELSSEQQQELTRKVERRGSTNCKYRMIRNVVGGNCSACYGGIPSKKVSYDVGDCKLVEWFCDTCWHKNKDQLDKRLLNMDFNTQ
jgi:hypothetical protein